jgi:TatD DNase family protein
LTRTMQSIGGFDHLYSTVGVHPTRATALADPAQSEAILSGLRQCINDGRGDKKVVAIGECGLDYDRLHFCSKEAQLVGFKAQLDLAAEFDLPMFLHNRNTTGDFARMIRENQEKMRRGGVVHSFDGSVEEMRELVDMGLYIGINGCSMKTPENLAMVGEIPENRLLLETDAPWCSIKPTHAGYKHIKSDFPRKKNDKYEQGFLVKDRNEPCTMIQVLEVVAAVRETDPVALSEVVYTNTEALFFSS